MYKLYFIFLMFFSVNVIQAEEVSAERVLHILEELNTRNLTAQEECDLGIAFYEGKGVDMSNQKALKHFKSAANQGNAEAQYYLGLMHQLGRGVDKNARKAVELYSQAAEQGHVVAQYQLGYMYRNSYGIKRDINKAIHWYKLAADQGYVPAYFMLGYIYETSKKNYTEAVKQYRMAADRGDSNSQYALGRMYSQGHGVEQDYETAIRWLEKALEQGHEATPYELDRIKQEMAKQEMKKK